MSENISTSEVLYRAANEIETRGWNAGGGWITETSAADRPICLEGGIMAALGMVAPPEPDNSDLFSLWSCPAYRAVADYLDRDVTLGAGGRADEPVEPLWRWNDNIARTATEVIEVLRACAVIEAAKENADVRESVTVR